MALSTIWPGLGHFGHNNRRGWLFTNLALASSAFGLGYIAARDSETLLVWSVNTFSLRLISAISLGTLASRALVALDAFRTAKRRYRRWPGRKRFRLGPFIVILLVASLMVGPHLLVVRFASAQLSVLSEVFSATRTATAVPTPLATAVTPNVDQPSQPISESPPNRVVEEASTEGLAPANTTTATSAAVVSSLDPEVPDDPGPTPWEGEPRLTVAFLGSDAGYDRVGVRTDTIVLFTMEVASGEAALFSIPRNWRHVTFPDGTPAAEIWPGGYPEILNEVYGAGRSNPEAFPGVDDPAGHAIKSALAQLTGLRVHYYVLLGMEGFVDAIDLFGGIDLYVTEPVEDRIKPIVEDGSPIEIAVEPGLSHLDGSAALGYVRSRTNSTDWSRMTRQRCVIAALITQVSRLELVYRYPSLSEIIADHVVTDIPLDRLGELIALVDRLDTARITTVNFVPPQYPPGDAPIAAVREAVQQALLGSSTETNESLTSACR